MHIRRCCRVTLFFCFLLSGLHPTASAQFAMDVGWYGTVIYYDGQFSPFDGRLKDRSDVSAANHIRIGIEYLYLLPEKKSAIPLRAGLFHDPEPAEDDPLDFYGISLGAGLSRSRYSIDLANRFCWANDNERNVSTEKA